MSVAATIRQHMIVVETVQSGTPAAPDSKSKITHDAWKIDKSLNASSTPPITMTSAQEITIASGVGSIDLTALPGTGGATLDGTGLKVQGVLLTAPGGEDGNAGPITIAPGASNPYSLGGATWAGEDLEPGDSRHYLFNDTLADVDGTHKSLDLTGTDGDVLRVQLLLG